MNAFAAGPRLAGCAARGYDDEVFSMTNAESPRPTSEPLRALLVEDSTGTLQQYVLRAYFR
jgi:hypothetical protein